MAWKTEHPIGKLALIKSMRLINPTISLKEAKDNYESFEKIWRNTVSERVHNNEHYHVYFVLLLIFMTSGNWSLLQNMATRVAREVNAAFFAILAGYEGAQKEMVLEENNRIVELMSLSLDVSDTEADILDSLVETIKEEFDENTAERIFEQASDKVAEKTNS